jgi:hypothetical protein
MSGTSFLAFVVTPALVLALGWGAVLLNEWHDRRQRHQHH